MLLWGVALCAVVAVGVFKRRLLWMVWCGVVLIWRGLRNQIGPLRGSKAQPRVRNICKRAVEAVDESLRPMLEATTPHAPCFGITGRNCEFLEGPKQFLESVIAEISGARQRIVIAALYLGVTARCGKIADAIDTALARNPRMAATILVDYGRAQRQEDGVSVMKLLYDLVAKYGTDRVQIRMFMVPLCGAMFRHAPPTIREIAGVQHVKAIVVDDNTLLTGANLNDNYFTYTQDRYMWVRNEAALATWVSRFVTTLGDMSYECVLAGNGELAPVFPECKPHPVYSGPSPIPYHEFSQDLNQKILDLLDEEHSLPEGCDTFVLPFVQLAAVGIEHDASMLLSALVAAPQAEITLSSAYPNYGTSLAEALNSSSAERVRLLFPHEDANGFSGAKGPKALVPPSYTTFMHNFLQVMKRSVDTEAWAKEGCTYHAKGVWMPSATIIGSSNMGYRSTNLDAELGFLIASSCGEFAARLDRELALLRQNTAAHDVAKTHTSRELGKKALLQLVTGILYPFL